VGTLVGFLTLFQIRANMPGLSLHRTAIFVLGTAVIGSAALALIGGAFLHGTAGRVAWCQKRTATFGGELRSSASRGR
jgi:hypothetical protein